MPHDELVSSYSQSDEVDSTVRPGFGSLGRRCNKGYLWRNGLAIVESMEYEHYNGPDGIDIRVPTDENYRTCAVCGGDCEPDTSLSAHGSGARIAFVCNEHGVQSVVDPFADLR